MTKPWFPLAFTSATALFFAWMTPLICFDAIKD